MLIVNSFCFRYKHGIVVLFILVDNLDQWIDSTQMVLYGHRSIVNQVRYNREKCLLASSGVEKIIKV